MALSTGPGEAEREPIDDYHVAPDVGQATRPASHHALAAANFVLLLILAAVSFALFWVIATMLGFV